MGPTLPFIGLGMVEALLAFFAVILAIMGGWIIIMVLVILAFVSYIFKMLYKADHLLGFIWVAFFIAVLIPGEFILDGLTALVGVYRGKQVYLDE